MNENHMPVCSCECGPDPAVPELLAALKWFIDDLTSPHTVMLDFDANVIRARAAIAKFEGVPPVEEYPDHGPTDPWQTSGPGEVSW